MGWSLLQSHRVSISLLCLGMASTHPAASRAFPGRAADVRGTRLGVPMAADTRGGGAGCRVCSCHFPSRGKSHAAISWSTLVFFVG